MYTTICGLLSLKKLNVLIVQMHEKLCYLLKKNLKPPNFSLTLPHYPVIITR